jgi:hypothetical protein
VCVGSLGPVSCGVCVLGLLDLCTFFSALMK